jgi:hypothetical protein
MATEPLKKLLATDGEDLAVVSAMLQDALVQVGEMTWQRDQGRFVLVANRFRWEGAPERDRKGEIHERVHSGLCVSHVTAVRRRGFDPRHPTGLLSLLAIRHQPREGGHAIDLAFAGGAEILLEVSELAVRLDDIDEPWPTRLQPTHDVEE